jgi:hypothetical protein
MKRSFLNNNASTSTTQQLEQDINDIIEFTSPHILKILSTKEAENIDNKVFAYVSKFLQTHKSVINKFGTISNPTVRSDIEKSLSAEFGMFTHFFETIADEGDFKYPPLLHLFHCFSIKIIVAYVLDERKWSHKDKHPEKEVTMEDLTVNTNNANPNIATDMEVEIAKEDQSLDVQNVITRMKILSP